MKKKLIAFDVTKALEKSVGELMSLINRFVPFFQDKIEESGVPIAKPAIKTVSDPGDLQSFFMGFEDRDIIDTYNELLTRGINVSFVFENSKAGFSVAGSKEWGTDSLLRYLANLGNKVRGLIWKIDLQGKQITRGSLGFLSLLDCLKYLNLSFCGILPREITQLSAVPSIESLEIVGLGISEEEFTGLTGISNLRRLVISRDKYSPAAKGAMLLEIDDLEIIEL